MSEVIRSTLRILTFRAGRDELVALDHRHLKFGLFCTWVVGVGRWWDDSRANLLQHLGLGSVIYVFVLTAFLWLLIRPLNPKNFRYTQLLTFVSLTSPPAIIYALPIERWMDLEAARGANAYFLGVVALWRVTMLAMYLHRVSQFRWVRLAIALLLPMCGIVTALTLLNLDRAAYDVANGIQEDGTSNDLAYLVLFKLTFYSVVALPPVFGGYFLLVYLDARSLAQKVVPFNRPKS